MFGFCLKSAAPSIVVLLLAATNVTAQASRTWVSSLGDDANPCSRTSPCKTFAGAISKTAAGGEIDVIDPGSYGPVTIQKSITIDGGPNAGGIVNSGVAGISVNAGAGDTVILRNISIQGVVTLVGSGLGGINIVSAGTVHVENCNIANQAKRGIDVQTVTPCRLFVTDTIIRDNTDGANGGGIYLKPGAGGSVVACLNRVQLFKNTYGIHAEDNTTTEARDCSFSMNDTHGVVAIGPAAASLISLENCSASNNSSSGLRSSGANATIRFGACMIDNNLTGLETVVGGKLLSFTDNRVGSNTTDGMPTGSIVLK